MRAAKIDSIVPRGPTLLSLALLLLPAACSRPSIGVETVLAQSGLSEALLDAASDATGTRLKVVVDTPQALLDGFKNGQLDALLIDDELGTDALLRDGAAGSAQPVCHHEMVLVGPKDDPVGIHTQLNFEDALRAIILGSGTFYRCGACSARAREEAIFASATELPKRGPAFLDAGGDEDQVVRAMQNAPGYALLSRPTLIRLLQKKEWSMKPVWSGDPLQVDTYRFVRRAADREDADKRAALDKLGGWLTGPDAQSLIKKFGVDWAGQSVYLPGLPVPGHGFKVTP